MVFPSGRRASQKARVFADYLERAVARSRAPAFERKAGAARGVADQ
jgi:hypothetical protein